MPNIIHLILATTFIFGSAPSATAISGQGQSPWFELNAPSAGTVPLCHLDYKPYGETKTEEGSLSVSRKFTGKELDEETGLYDYSARQYDPKIGRFISPDPLEVLLLQKASISKDSLSFRFRNIAEQNLLIALLYNPQNLNKYSYCDSVGKPIAGTDINLYEYAHNNPVNWVDPNGEYAIWIVGTAVVLVTTYAIELIAYSFGNYPASGLRGGATATNFMYETTQYNRNKVFVIDNWTGWPKKNTCSIR